MMKARQYDRRLLTRGIQPNIFSIRESNGIQAMTIEYFHKNDPKLKADIERIVTEMRDAKEYGSILNITPVDFTGLYARFDEIREDINMMQMSAMDELLPLVKCAEVLAQKYDVVVTNPPYLGSSRFSTKLNDFVIANYPDVKADLSMVMYKHALRDMCQKNGFVSFITTTSWMFLSSFEKLRSFVLAGYDFESLVDFGTELFEGKVGHNPIVAWVNRKSHTDHAMTGIRLVDYCYSRRDEKETEFFNKRNYHYPKQSNFSKIPGSPVAYWVSEAFYSMFNNAALVNYMDFKEGITTGDNEKYLRFWHEVSFKKVFLYNEVVSDEGTSWVPCNKGGEFRRWYGNRQYLIDWSENGNRLKRFKGSSFRNADYQRKEGGTFSNLSSGLFGARYSEKGFAFESKGTMFFGNNLLDVLAYVNSKAFGELLAIVCPTLDFKFGTIQKLPYKPDSRTSDYAKCCVNLSKGDWDSYETSWDFKRNPLV